MPDKQLAQIPSKPLTAFPEFYANPVIRALSGVPRWTVSDNEKVPINMRELASTGRIWGAHEISEQCLMTLPELMNFLPDATNNAFYLRARTEGLVVLDIEPKCPPEVAEKLLSMPGALYAERSMSGNGYHIVFPLPANFWDYPIATNKKVLQEEHGWYELLLDHWVTFTRDMIPVTKSNATNSLDAWSQQYAIMAEKAKEAPTVEFDLSARPDIPRREQIIELMTRQPLTKTIDDFNGNSSGFEFSVMGTLYNRLLPILVIMQDLCPDTVFDESVRSWLIYEAASQMIEHRSKHDEDRNGLPLLLNNAVKLVALRMGEEAQRQ